MKPVRRILRVKYALGLFDHPYTQVTPAYEPTPEKRALTRKVADESLVLLKNDPIEGAGTLLPLKNKAKTVALIGPLADNQRDLLGAWSSGDPIASPCARRSKSASARSRPLRRRVRPALRPGSGRPRSRQLRWQAATGFSEFPTTDHLGSRRDREELRPRHHGARRKRQLDGR